MELIVPTKQTHEGFCSFHSTRKEITVNCCNNRRFKNSSLLVGQLRKQRQDKVFSISKIETFSSVEKRGFGSSNRRCKNICLRVS